MQFTVDCYPSKLSCSFLVCHVAYTMWHGISRAWAIRRGQFCDEWRHHGWSFDSAFLRSSENVGVGGFLRRWCRRRWRMFVFHLKGSICNSERWPTDLSSSSDVDAACRSGSVQTWHVKNWPIFVKLCRNLCTIIITQTHVCTIVWPVGTTSELPAGMAVLCGIAHFSAASQFLLVHSIFSNNQTRLSRNKREKETLILIWRMTTNATTRASDLFHRRAGRCVASGDFNFTKRPFILRSGVTCEVCVVAFVTCHRKRHKHPPHIRS